MSKRDLARKRVVILAGSVAALSAAAPMLMKSRPTLGIVWVSVMVVAMIYVIVLFGRAYRMPR